MKRSKIGVCTIIIDKSSKRLLLGKRINSYGEGSYGLPGGGLELDEKIIDCAKREVLEETSLRITSLIYIGVIRETQSRDDYYHFVFVSNNYKGTPKVVEPDKCRGWEWFSLSDVPKNILQGHAAALEMYREKGKYGFKEM